MQNKLLFRVASCALSLYGVPAFAQAIVPGTPETVRPAAAPPPAGARDTLGADTTKETRGQSAGGNPSRSGIDEKTPSSKGGK